VRTAGTGNCFICPASGHKCPDWWTANLEYYSDDQWVIASFDLAMWLLAVVFWLAFKKVKNHQGPPAKKAKTTAVETEV
ncbi:hypothetical protein WCE10_21780, partial [Cronobacter muytjensii]|uniref:hypothetical protein n=1 Tax=Cronobacter muytjensii TaxID=413501 RepID=UPI0034D597FA